MAEILPQLVAGRQVVLVTDAQIQKLFPALCAAYPGTILIPAGEAGKTLAVAENIYSVLSAQHLDRTGLILGLGGGSICDLTGFVAATYMRGLACGYVPTTLLAQVDAAIGGKNGVNLGGIKNLVGTTRQPEFVLCDPSFLNSLPELERASGFAEIVKHAALFDSNLFAQLQASAGELWALGPGMAEVVGKSAQLKAKVVSADEFEKNERKLLNLGHTLGHGIEVQTGISHGAAVACGMVLEAEF